MRLREFLDPSAVQLALGAPTRDEVFQELVRLLRLGDKSEATVVRQLLRREVLGSTGFGHGIAIPHCRTMAVTRLRIAFGRHATGIPMQAVDGRPVQLFFLLVAPPQEVSNQYLQILGRIAQFVHDPEVPPRLLTVASPDELYAVMDAKGV